MVEHDLKPVADMTVADLRAEIEAHNDGANHTYDMTVFPTSGKKAELAEAVVAIRELRGDASAPEQLSGRDDDTTAEVPVELADEVATAIALREQAVSPVSSIPLPAEWNALEVMANRLANSRVVPDAYRGRPDDVIAAWLYGRELGLGQMTALRDIYMIEGRAAIAAHRQLGLLRAGGVVVLESGATDERAFIVARRTDTGEVMTVDFTMEEAKRIKTKGGKFLVDGINWQNYPKDMLWARCVGRLTRRLGPDMIGGLPPYVAEEVADFSDWGVEYGAEGSLSVSQARRVQQPDRVQMRPDWNIPETWSMLAQRLEHQLGAPEWDVWRGQLLREVYDVAAIGELPREQRPWQGLCSVLYRLEEHEREHELAAIPRVAVRAAFAECFDGVALEGPAWRIYPTEEDRPSYEGFTAAGEPDDGIVDAEVIAEPEPLQDDLDIEFGAS